MPGAGPTADKSDLEEAMGHVVEAFRFLSARVETLEARADAEDRPVDGAAWLVPARELGPWAGPVAAHLSARATTGAVIHADCGRGDLLHALDERGTEAHGVEPRGAVALRAIEAGCTVTIAEAAEYLSGRPEGSCGGIVLSGVVDRLPLHALLSLLAGTAAPWVGVRRWWSCPSRWPPRQAGTRRHRIWSADAPCTRPPGSCCSSAPASSKWRHCPTGSGSDRRIALAAAAPS